MHIEKRSRYQIRAEVREVNRGRRNLIHEFRSAWPVAMACLLACTFAISKPAQASITLPGDPYKIYTYHEDISNDRWQKSLTINKFAGGGIEPMLDIELSLRDFIGGPDSQPSAGAYSSFQWDHKIMPLGTLPAGFTGVVPYTFGIRIEGSITYGGYFQDVQASVNGLGVGFGSPPVSSFINYGGFFSGTTSPGTILQANLSAGIWIYTGNKFTNEAQIIVDPYIYIEPTWEYASYFGVFQAPGPNDNGVWQQVNRDWMAAVPIPASVWMLATGLVGLVSIRKRLQK